MGYSTINGAGINEEESGTEGIELGSAGTAEAFYVMLVAGTNPLELGSAGLQFGAEPEGLDLVETETHTALYNALILVPGTDLVVQGTAVAQSVLSYPGAQPLELGALRARNGADIDLTPPGLELVHVGLHSAFIGQPPPDVAVEVAGARPLEVGAPAAIRSATLVDVGSAQPFEFGTVGIGVALPAAGATPFEFGQPSSATLAVAVSGQPLELGAPAAAFRVGVLGFDLVATGTHSASRDANEVFPVGANPFELGEPINPTHAVYPRQIFPLQVGQPSISRGTTC